MPDSATNFCKKDIMPICTAPNTAQQKMCRFFKKASYTDKCMFFVFDKYCDCLQAQLETEAAPPGSQEAAIDAWVCP